MKRISVGLGCSHALLLSDGKSKRRDMTSVADDATATACTQLIFYGTSFLRVRVCSGLR